MHYTDQNLLVTHHIDMPNSTLSFEWYFFGLCHVRHCTHFSSWRLNDGEEIVSQ